MQTRLAHELKNVLSALAVAALVSPVAVAEWTMDEPTGEESFTTNSSVPGYGDAPGSVTSYSFKIKKYVSGSSTGTVMNAETGSAEASWNMTVDAPSGGWTESGSGGQLPHIYAELWANGEKQAEQRILVSDETEM